MREISLRQRVRNILEFNPENLILRNHIKGKLWTNKYNKNREIIYVSFPS